MEKAPDVNPPEHGPVEHEDTSSELLRKSPREISMGTVVRLMGLATDSEVKLLETKIDTLNTKVATLTNKFERLASELQHLLCKEDLERIDLQLAEIRALTKKIARAEIDEGTKVESAPQAQRETHETEVTAKDGLS